MNATIGLNLGILRWGIGALLIQFNFDKFSKPLLNGIKLLILHLEHFSGKS